MEDSVFIYSLPEVERGDSYIGRLGFSYPGGKCDFPSWLEFHPGPIAAQHVRPFTGSASSYFAGSEILGNPERKSPQNGVEPR